MRGLDSASTHKTSIYRQPDDGQHLGFYHRVLVAAGVGIVAVALLAAIEGATTAGGTEYAPLELKSARDKLEAANQAVADENYEKAAMLASEAQVDAKLAETKSMSAKAQKAVAETQDNLRTMLNEINRNSQQQQEQRAN
jgi:septal ring factor EnvC (AmiA/AmiB activator)